MLIYYHSVWPITLNPLLNRLEGRVDEGGFVADHGTSYERCIPSILKIHLSSRHVEFAMQSGKQRSKPAALLLERGAGRQMEMHSEYSNHGG